jgi:hypothetical protein
MNTELAGRSIRRVKQLSCKMPSVEYDLGYLETAAELLEKYLLSKEIYWKMNASSPPGERRYPSLTLGGLLLVLERLQARQLNSIQDERKIMVENKIHPIRMKWRTAWGGKAREEYRSRINLWRNYLEEFRQDPKGNFDRYQYEVSRREMLNLLSQEADDIPAAQKQMLAGLDRILEGLMVPGDFIWDESLTAGFPPEEHPYLYLRLK